MGKDQKGRQGPIRRVRYESGSHLVAVPPGVVDMLGVVRGSYVEFCVGSVPGRVLVKRVVFGEVSSDGE